MKSFSNNQKTTSRAASNTPATSSKQESSRQETTPFKSNPGLPDKLQRNMEQAFGQDFSGVNVHTNSKRATELNAQAFAQGENVHFAPGRFNPDSDQGKKLIGHEFAHVVQQRSGVVKPTKTLRKGIGVNDSHRLESEADTLGAKAVRGEKITQYNSVGLGMRDAVRTVQAKSDVIQRAINTSGGSWDVEYYDLKRNESRGTVYPAARGVRGLDIKIKFTPGAGVDAERIGLTQTANSIKSGSPTAINATVSGRSISAGDAVTTGGQSDEGAHIDRASAYNNPIYPVKSRPSASLDDNNTSAGWGQNGIHYTDSAGKAHHQIATLLDKPRLFGAAKNSGQYFETTALATKGRQTGTYYGSVKWGWETDAAGAFTKITFAKVSEGVPSSTFMKSAELWNAGTSSTGAATVDLPLVDVHVISNRSGSRLNDGLNLPGPVRNDLLPLGTRVQVLGPGPMVGPGPVMSASPYSEIRVVDGPLHGANGYIRNSDLRDERP